MTISKDETGCVLKVSGALEIGVAQELQQALGDYAQEAAGVVVDLAAAETCDAACLQVLFSARQTALMARKSFRLLQVCGAVVKTSAALGLSLAALTADVPGKNNP